MKSTHAGDRGWFAVGCCGFVCSLLVFLMGTCPNNFRNGHTWWLPNLFYNIYRRRELYAYYECDQRSAYWVSRIQLLGSGLACFFLGCAHEDGLLDRWISTIPQRSWFHRAKYQLQQSRLWYDFQSVFQLDVLVAFVRLRFTCISGKAWWNWKTFLGC